MNMDIDKLILRKLAKQAGMSDDKYGMFFAEVKHNEDGVDLQMFTELIIQECVNIGDNYQDILGNEPECFNCRKVAYGIVDKIKKHFGVEQ